MEIEPRKIESLEIYPMFFMPNLISNPLLFDSRPYYPSQSLSVASETFPEEFVIFVEAAKTYSTGVNYEARDAFNKRRCELLSHLESLQAEGFISFRDLQEIMFQHYILEIRRGELWNRVGEIVVVCNGELFFGTNLKEMVEQAKAKYGDRPYYSETIGIPDYPSPFG